MKRTTTAAALALAAALLPASAGAQTAWQPTRPIEFIASAAAGGGTDQFSRTIQSIIQKYNWSPQPISVINRGGGSGAEAFVYAMQHRADPHKVLFGTSNEWTLPMSSRIAYKHGDLVPVAAMVFDEFLLWVKNDAPYQNTRQFLDAVRARPGEYRLGGAFARDMDQLLTRMIEKASGTRFTYIPFRSGGETATQLAGGHIAANVNNPAENLGQWRAGGVRPLCVFSAERLPAGPRITATQGWQDIPTCVSEGLNIREFSMPRTVWLPQGSSPEAVAWWVDLLRRAFETPEWKEYVERSSQTPRFLAGAEFRDYVRRTEAEQRQIYQDEGWVVN